MTNTVQSLGQLVSPALLSMLVDSYWYAADMLALKVQEKFGCRFVRTSPLEVELSFIGDNYPVKDDPKSMEEDMVLFKSLFVDDPTLQNCLASQYDGYPEVCDVAADMVNSIIATKYGGRYEIFVAQGHYAEDAYFHCWSVLVNKSTGQPYIIDLTYVQFDKNAMAATPMIGHSGEQFLDKEGNPVTQKTFTDLRSRVSTATSLEFLPPAIIPYSDPEANKWTLTKLFAVVHG